MQVAVLQDDVLLLQDNVTVPAPAVFPDDVLLLQDNVIVPAPAVFPDVIVPVPAVFPDVFVPAPARFVLFGDEEVGVARERFADRRTCSICFNDASALNLYTHCNGEMMCVTCINRNSRDGRCPFCRVEHFAPHCSPVSSKNLKLCVSLHNLCKIASGETDFLDRPASDYFKSRFISSAKFGGDQFKNPSYVEVYNGTFSKNRPWVRVAVESLDYSPSGSYRVNLGLVVYSKLPC